MRRRSCVSHGWDDLQLLRCPATKDHGQNLISYAQWCNTIGINFGSKLHQVRKLVLYRHLLLYTESCTYTTANARTNFLTCSNLPPKMYANCITLVAVTYMILPIVSISGAAINTVWQNNDSMAGLDQYNAWRKAL